ncbi:ferritin-like domain-containing protein [Lichenicoccus sp.]|uniref:ferritin-like domain-containing protein n=1 Tax=Lichenicoccus sp. TaxID=2781899 RepID=UPI003D0EA825
MLHTDIDLPVAPALVEPPRERSRRSLVQRVGIGAMGTAIAGSIAGVVASSSAAEAAPPTDDDIFNFALNFEYLGAEYYLRALTGSGLAANLLTGTGTQGTVTGGSVVPWNGSAIEAFAQRLAIDEMAHVEFIRAATGTAAIAEPSIDLGTAWSVLARAAGLINASQTFNPFGDPISFLIGAYVIEDVCVTALAGAAALLTGPNNIAAAAGLLGTESYQAGAIRTLLSDLGAGQVTDAISALRAKLSGVADDIGTTISGNAYNIVPNDTNGLVFRRTPAQVLNIAYGGATSAPYGFFPNKVNGVITSNA